MSFIENSHSNRNSNSELNYYNTFSKYVLETPVIRNVMNTVMEPAESAITYHAYQTTPHFSFEKYKLGELKSTARHYNLHVSGNKPIIIERLENFFRRTRAAISIQSVFRRHLVFSVWRLHGPAFRTPEICVNDCDFYSLEPLANIPVEQFFSFADEKKFVYGFDMFSLITLMKKTHKIINPYNRDPIPSETFSNLLGLYKKTHILFPHLFSSTDMILPSSQVSHALSRRRNTRPTPENRNIGNTLVETNTLNIQFDGDNTSIEDTVRNTIRTIQSQPIDSRIRELFMEINLLGNYAESRWFTDLDRLRMARYYQYYYDWWHTRSRIPVSVRNNICILGDPFTDVHLLYVFPSTSIEEYQEACVRMMEHMVYGGRDLEYRKLGALHILSILTMVSSQARVAMPWLYDSILL